MLIDGKKIAEKMLGELKPPGGLNLAAVLVGSIGSGKKFLEIKKKAAEKAGIDFKVYEFPENIDQEKLEEEIKKIADDDKNSGVIIELPLPKHLDQQKLLDLVPPQKDPDVLSSKAQYDFMTGKSQVLPPSVEAIKQIFAEHNVDPAGKKAAVFGHGILVGKPISVWLARQGAKAKIVDEFTPAKEAKQSAKEADIIVAGVGKPNLITPNMVKDGAILIDFGFNPESTPGVTPGVVGDISKGALEKASIATPVPGGVGPIVVAAVLKNLISLSKS